MKRTKSELPGFDLNYYSMNVDFIRSEEINNLMEEYGALVSFIISKKKLGIDMSSEIERLKEIKYIISNSDVSSLVNRNILKSSKVDDKRIGFGKDSNVYEFQNNGKYVYKEGKEGSENNVLYLKNKYLVLKKYLGDLIPKSYFLYGESLCNKGYVRGIKDIDYIGSKVITIQRKVNGKDSSEMSAEEKLNIDFLNQLEVGHAKYVLLKMFLSNLIKNMGLPKKSMDLQLDLGKLSNRDSFHHDEINFIENELRSPNLMWDGEKVSFIDFGGGEWDNDKELVFSELMKDETFHKWKSILDLYGYEL